VRIPDEASPSIGLRGVTDSFSLANAWRAADPGDQGASGARRTRIQGLTAPARRRDNARAERARRARRHCPPFQMTMDVHPSRTAVTRLHRVAAAKIEPTRGDRARPAGTRLD